MKRILTLLAFSVISCGHSKSNKTIPPDTVALYSDYFVFIGDDAKAPLVIPIDFNWNKIDSGYSIEFKSWYGTQKDWPILYKKKEYTSNKMLPQESFQHSDIKGFQFNSKKQEITVKIPYAPEFSIVIPQKADWVLAPSVSAIEKQTYASKTSITIKGKKKTGWILYEKIRWKKDEIVDFGDFETFYWIPLLVNGDLYHFEAHKEEKIGYKWFIADNKIQINKINHFDISVTKTISDAKSGRKEIPKEIHVKSTELDITLRSKGEQVGYGGQYPKGLGYYRQSLLVSSKASQTIGYGMLELVIENN